MTTRSIVAALLLPALAIAQVPWTTYQANARHDGALPVTLNPATLLPRWEKALGAGTLVQQVTAAGGKVFASGPNRKLFAFDASTGDELWTVDFGSVFSVNPPAYDGGRVYIQTCNHSSDTFLRCYDATTGALVFQAPHSAQWEHYLAPTIVDGVAYVDGGYFGGMYAFDAQTGQQRWFQANLPQYDQWTPTVENGIAYAYIGGMLYALDAATGTQMYTIADPGFSWLGWSMNLAPVLGGQHDAFVVHTGRLVRFNLQSHTLAYAIGSGYVGQPAAKDGVVYAVSGNQLRAIDAIGGDVAWAWTAPSALSGAVVATQGHVLVHSQTTTYLVDLQTHQSVWSTTPAGDITVGEGAIYIASGNGVLKSIGFDALPTPTAVAPSRMHYTSAPIAVTITGTAFTHGENLTVRVGEVEASGVQIVDDQTIVCTVPPLGPGLVDIVVANSIGQTRLAGSFAYTPALHSSPDPYPGGSVTLSYIQDVNETIVGAWGTDSIAIAVPPFEGELLVAPPAILFVLPGWVQPRFDLTLPVPANPTLTGAQLWVQSLTGSDLAHGVATFSNARLVTVQ